MNIKMNKRSSNFSFDPLAIVKGAFGGGTGILASHWIDTIKTHYQTTNSKSIFESARYLYSQYGWRASIKGISAPLMGTIVEKATVFGVQENIYMMLPYENEYIKTSISGGGAGIACTLIVAPVEYFKIKMQSGNTFNYVFKSIFDQTPLNAIRTLYNGLPATLIREGPGFAVYFTTFSFLKRNITDKTTFTPFHAMGFGAISGVVAWASMYPSDSIKTMQQRYDISFKESIHRIYSTHGFRGFFRAFDLAMMRAIPLHAGVFGGVSMVSYLISGHY